MAKRKRLKKNHSNFLLVLGIATILTAGLFASKVSSLFVPCANSITCIKDLSGAYQIGKESTFMGKIVPQPKYAQNEPIMRPVLGATTEEKHIFVDLTTQKLSAYEGKKLVFDFPISSGKWYPTPTGDFHIWVKLRNAHMEGGDPAAGTYYNLYNVPYTMFFANDSISKDRGFSLHGAYWHNNFGHPMSHGCVNIRPIDAKKLYDWADPPTEGTTTYVTPENQGTLVTIYGQVPNM